ncbi:TRAP transporter small permease [Vallitalea okinawensis]|uniref:TRAP transporter small permease n=1 Tax=Vallitalea okinawensis TaxID=2078660 RepID=UPI000CFAF20B|nr:TRAP transporter small permease [Vallitalea okinawensis]
MRTKAKLILNNLEEIICSIALSVTIIAVMINTFLGWTIGKRFGQLEELAITGFVWVTFLGISVVYKRSKHIRIDFIVSTLPEKIKRVLNIVTDIVVLLFNMYIIYYAYILAMGAIQKTTSLLNISYFYIDLSVILGFLFMTIHLIRNIVNDIRKGRGAA